MKWWKPARKKFPNFSRALAKFFHVTARVANFFPDLTSRISHFCGPVFPRVPSNFLAGSELASDRPRIAPFKGLHSGGLPWAPPIPPLTYQTGQTTRREPRNTHPSVTCHTGAHEFYEVRHTISRVGPPKLDPGAGRVNTPYPVQKWLLFYYLIRFYFFRKIQNAFLHLFWYFRTNFLHFFSGAKMTHNFF